MAVTALEPRIVPRMVCGRRNFQKASLKATSFWAGLGSGVCGASGRARRARERKVGCRAAVLAAAGPGGAAAPASPGTHQRARSCCRCCDLQAAASTPLLLPLLLMRLLLPGLLLLLPLRGPLLPPVLPRRRRPRLEAAPARAQPGRAC